MGDCRLCSLVFCHVGSAQILEFSFTDFPGTLLMSALGQDVGFGTNKDSPEHVYLPLIRTHSSPDQPCGEEACLGGFPQASERLSKANVEIWFSCVNECLELSECGISKRVTNVQNVGD
jgi:hypothetical protein